MLTEADQETANTIFSLLRQGSTSLAVMREFLRSKKLPFSAGSWDDLWTNRVQPKLNSSEISLQELRDLLRGAEESGHQHIFLYQCPVARAAQLLAPTRIQRVVKGMGLEALTLKPLDLELPATPTIVDIRGATGPGGSSLLVKQVETRQTQTFLRWDKDQAAGIVSKVYSISRKRAVNLARLHSSGVLEVRIAAQDNTTKYEKNLTSFFNAVGKLFPRDEFSELSLQKAKDRLWNDRDRLAEEVRFNNSSAKNDIGTLLSLSTATLEESLSQDEGSEGALQAFLKNDASVVSTNLHFLVPETQPQRAVHVLISGLAHEFAVTASCSAEDYEYVCRKIQSLNH